MSVTEYRRGTQIVRRFSQKEDLLITKWRVQGYGTTDIARSLFVATAHWRSPATINMRLKTLAKIEEKDD